MEYVNTDAEHRVWPRIQTPDGHTLELDPGETVELDLPEDFEDAYLRPVTPAAEPAPVPPAPAPSPTFAPRPPVEPVAQQTNPPTDDAAKED